MNGRPLPDEVAVAFSSQHTKDFDLGVQTTYWCPNGTSTASFLVYLGNGSGIDHPPNSMGGPGTSYSDATHSGCYEEEGILLDHDGNRLVDVNGDGLTDLLTEGRGKYQVRYGAGARMTATPITFVSFPGSFTFQQKLPLVRDLDLDGL